jgi:hypothetical protein
LANFTTSVLFRRIVKILSRLLLILLLLILTVWILVHFTFVQNWLVKQTARKLSRELQTEVTVKHVDFSLFNKMLLEGLLVKDRLKDTLLYTGRVTVNITDWFFFKDKAEISYLSLEQTNVLLSRKDSVWNYQFLIDYFSTPSSNRTKKNGIELTLKKLVLKQIQFTRKDDWKGVTEKGNLSSLNVELNLMDLTNKDIRLNELVAEDPFFSINNYPGLRPPKKSIADVHPENDTIEQWNTGKWKFFANNIQIKNGEFRNDLKTEREPYTYFDGAHFQFYAINGQFKNVNLIGDTLKAELKFQTKERSGFTVNNMDAHVEFHPTAMEFTKMTIETPFSKLGNAFAMRYNHFNHDMASFITHVRMEGNFENSKLHTNDIAFFAPELKSWNDVIYMTGKAEGTVDNLKGKNIKITTGRNTLFDGDFVMNGLPDINNTFLDINANRFNTTYSDAVQIYPGLVKVTKPAINQIKYINFKGSFTGFIKDFVAFGTIETNLGTITSDINLKLPDGSQPIYSGKLKTQGFELGRFLNESSIGRIAMDGSLKGRSFDINKLFAEIDGNINQFQVLGYNYQNIIAKGIVEKKKFDGALAINDSNLALNITGLVDFGKDTPLYRLNGLVYKSNFKNLGFTDRDISFKGDIDFNFKVKNIDDFTGTAFIQNAELLSNGNKLSFDSLYLSNTNIAPGVKQLILRSNEIDGKLTGNYNLRYLPDVTLAFLHNYLPSYIPKPRLKIANQDFEFDITTYNINEFINVLDIPVKGFNQSIIKGSINVQQNKLKLDVNIPSFTYNNILFNQVRLESEGNFNHLVLKGDIAEVQLNDSLRLPNTSFSIAAANDTGSITINTRATQTLKDADLRARFKAEKEGITLTFQPSTLLLNEKKWVIENESDFFIGKGKIQSNGIKFSSGNEELLAYTEPSGIGTGNDIVIELKKFEVGDFLPYFLTDPRLEGTVTGRIDVINPLGKIHVDAEIKADKFRLNNDSLGTVTINSNYNQENGIINYTVESKNEGHDFIINGNTNIADPKNIVTDNILKIENEQLSLLNKYLSIILSDIKGTGKGVLRVKGKGEAPDIIGQVTLNNASFVLDYTKCRYKIADETVINFKEGAIDFGNIHLSDTAGRKATFSGTLNHQFFKNMYYDMSFYTDNPSKGLLVLNTTKKDNDLFYGRVVANANGSIRGPANKMELELNGEPTDSSSLYIPTSDSRVTGTADFIVFRKYGKEMKAETEIKGASSLNVEVNVIANPYAKVYLILDELTNDIIEGQGNGAINLRVGTNEKTTINGNFEITKGRYNFNWQSLFKKPFLINKGSIQWNGDPYDARINIDAAYLVENVALLPELTTGCSNERYNMSVIGKLTNTLKDPVITFRFELPQGHPCRNNPVTINGLNQLYNNPDELNRQVFSLLLLGSFNSSASGIQSNSITSSILTSAAGTLSEFIAQQVTVGLDAVLKSIPGINKLKLDPYVTFTPGMITGAQAQGLGFQGTGGFGFTRRLLNGKLLLKAGGSYLLTSGQATSLYGNNLLTPDLSVEWLLSPDGKLRLIGFYRTIFDLQRRSNRSGLSFSYVKDFEDLF